jgi:hypothetical protein
VRAPLDPPPPETPRKVKNGFILQKEPLSFAREAYLPRFKTEVVAFL